MSVEKTDYVEISFNELKEMKISMGDLYWKKGSGTFTKVLNSGELVNFEKLNKFSKVTKCLYLDLKCNRQFVEKGESILTSLLNSNDEIERIELKDTLLAHLYPVYWAGESNGSMLELVLIFNNSFIDSNSLVIQEMDNNAHVFFQRSLLCSSLITLSAICLGYSHGEFLKDLYNSCLYFNYSFAKESFSSIDIESLEKARATHLNWSEHKDELEKSVDLFNYEPKHTRFKKLVSYHHELLNGDGALVGLNQEEVGDLEKIVIWIENIIEYGNDNYLEGAGNKFLQDIFKSNSYDLEILESKLQRSLAVSFESKMKPMENVA